MTKRDFIKCGALFLPSTMLGQGFSPADIAFGRTGPTPTCVTTGDVKNGDNSLPFDIHRFGVLKVAFKITASSTQAVCKVAFALKKSGTPTSNFWVDIWSHNAGSDLPNAVITNGASATRSASTFTTSYVNEEFTYATSPTMSNGTVYWIGVSTAGDDASNYVQVGIQNGGASVRLAYFDTGWVYFADRTPKFTITV